MSWIRGVGLTPFGRLAGRTTLDLMNQAAADAGLGRGDVDGLIVGYSTTLPHLMLSTVFEEHFGLRPSYAHGVQLGGATGYAMVMLAHMLVEAGVVRHMLVVAGENRLTGQTRDAAVQTVAQVGHPVYEVPLGPTIPAYYGLVALRYLDVLASKPIAEPLRILDCCPVSDGGAVVIVSRERLGESGVRILGAGQAHTHQHVSAAPNQIAFGATQAATRAGLGSRVQVADVSYAGIYNSFTVTLAILLEELGLASRGRAGAKAAEERFDIGGALPLNTHGGLLCYSHCGVGEAMAHLVETQRQMSGRAGLRQVRNASVALLHGDGGVLSSHVSLLLEQAR